MNNPVDFREICFYFDSETQNTKDTGLLSEKLARWLNLRRPLLSLPDESFEATMQTLENVVSSALMESKDKANVTKDSRKTVLKTLLSK